MIGIRLRNISVDESEFSVLNAKIEQTFPGLIRAHYMDVFYNRIESHRDSVGDDRESIMNLLFFVADDNQFAYFMTSSTHIDQILT
jgi:hypothetical protein